MRVLWPQADPYAHSAAAHNVSPPLPNQLSMHAPATHSSGNLGAPPHPLSTAGHQMRAYAALGNGALPGAAGALAHMSAMPAISSMSSVFSPGGSYMAASGSTVVAQARMNPLFRPGGPIFGPMPTTTTTTTTTTTRQRIRRPSNRNPLAPLISPPQPTVEPFSSSVQYHSLRSVQPVCKEPYGLRPHDGCENSLGSQGVAHRGVKHVGSVPSALVGAGLCHSGEQPDSSTTRAHLAHHAASSQDRGIDCHAPEPGHDGSVDSADRVDMGQGNERLHDPHDPHSVQDPDAVTLLADETELDGCGAADEAHAAGGAAEPASPASADAPALQLWQEQAGSSFPSPLADAPSPVASWFGAGRRGVTAAAAVAVAGAGAAAATPVRPAAPAAVLPVLSPVVPGSAAGLSLAARAAHAAGPAAPSPPPFRLDSCAPQGPAAAAAVAQGGEALWGVGVSHGQGESDVGRVTAPVWDEDDTSPHDVTVEALEQRFAAARSSARTGGGGSASGWQAFVTNHAHRCSPPPKDRARPALRLAASPVRPPRNGEHLPTTTHHQDAVIEGAAHDNDTWDGMRDDAGAQGPHSAAQSHSSAQAMADSAQGSDTSADGSPGRYAPSKDPWFTQHQYTHTLTGPAADEHMDETDGCEKPLVQCECETPRASVTGPLGGGMGLGVGVGDNDAGSTGQSVRGKSRVREPLPSPQGRLNLAGTDTHAEADTHTVRSAQGSDTPGMAGTDAVADLDAAGPSEPVSVAQRDGACRLVKVEEGLASQYEHGSYPVRVAHSSVAQQGTVAAALQRGSEAMQRVPAAASSPVTMPMATPGASMPALSTHLQPSPAADSDHAHAASPAHSGDAGLAGGGGVGWPTSPGDGLHVRILPPGMSGRSLPPSAAAAAASMSAPVVFVSLPPDGPWQNPDRDRRMRETAVRRLVEVSTHTHTHTDLLQAPQASGILLSSDPPSPA